MEDFDFSDAGDLDVPTMRGNANLDVQDYQNYPGSPGSSFLDDELQEDVLSTPGSGAGPASDIDGMEDFDLTNSDDGDPGMSMTEFGSHPWKVGGGGGYRPASMQTDLSGDENSAPAHEVAVRMAAQSMPTHRVRLEQRNRQPSNDDVDPQTLFDRHSFEFDDDPQNVIGTGIFDTEEGVVWNPSDGSFANDYALPAYIGQEDSLDVQQSQMWDSVANNWRVVQPSGGGVTFSTRVSALKPTQSPFTSQQWPSMRPERTGPRSHIEAFGRAAAKAVVDEARLMPQPAMRATFLTQATEALGVGQAAKCRQVAERLVQTGYSPDTALEDTLAHCVMHATMRDIADRSKGKAGLPRIDKMSRKVSANSGAIRQAVATHIAPLAMDQGAAKSDMSALIASPAAAGMGQVAVPDAPVNTNRNLLLGVAAAGLGYLFLTKTDQGQAVQKNVSKHARKLARKVGL